MSKKQPTEAEIDVWLAEENRFTGKMIRQHGVFIQSVSGEPMFRMTVEMLPNPAHVLFAANSFYQRPDEFSVPAFQLIYDDDQGQFPWDDGYSIPAWVQPRPGEFRA